jgi:glycosyltransferase 2 family protein
VKKRLLTLLKLIITLGLLYILFRKIDFSTVKTSIAGADYRYILVSLICWPISILFVSVKWFVLLRSYGVSVAFQEVFDLYWIGTFFNNFLPSSIGGDSYKFVYLRNKQKDAQGKTLASIVIDRGIGLLVMFALALAFGLPYLELLGLPNYINVLLCAFLSLAVIVPMFILFWPKKIRLPEPAREGWLKKLTGWVNILLAYDNNGAILISVAMSIAFYCTVVASFALLFAAFHQTISLPVYFFCISVVSIAEMFPFAINSIGIREGAGVFFFSLFGINASITVTVYILSRLTNLFGSSTGGIRYLFFKARGAHEDPL